MPEVTTTTSVTIAESSLAVSASAQPVMAERYTIQIEAPETRGMLAYLVGPGADLELNGIDLATSTLSVDNGNLRIGLGEGSEVLLLDFVASAESDQPPMIISESGALPAQVILAGVAALAAQPEAFAEIAPAAGPEGGPDGGPGFAPPTIVGDNFGDNSSVLSSVIGPFGFARTADSIDEELPPEIALLGVDVDPDAIDDAFATDEDVALNLTTADLLANDVDADGDVLTVISVDSNSTQGGTITFDQVTGNIVYTPAENFNGTDTFTYTITDGTDTDTATVTIAVAPVNDAPVAEDDSAATDEDNPITLTNATILANDFDVDGDTLTITDVQLAFGQGTAVLEANGDITFTPAANFNGPVELEYTISDGNGGTDTARIRIQVRPLDDNPLANDDNATTPEDTPILLTEAFLTANDVDPDGDALNVIDAIITSGGGTVVVQANGDVLFTPEPNFNGTAVLEYLVTDGTTTTSAFVNVVVTPVNDAPEATDDALTTPEDTALTFTGAFLLGNDADVDGDNITIQATTQPINGVLVDNGNGTFTYTPNANFNGQDTFTYTITDGNGATDTATVTVDVTPVNDPDAVDDFFVTNEDTALTMTTAQIVANDIDDQGLALTIQAVSLVAGQGTVELQGNGDVVFTPAANFNGAVTLQYTITDPDGNTDTANIFINVLPANDAPVATDDVATMNEDAVLVLPAGTILANDNDPDGDPLTITNVVVQQGQGVAAIDAGGNIIFTPDANFNGDVVLEYTIDDGNGGTDTALINITVLPINDAPVAADDAVTTDEDTAVTINVLTNDNDVDGDALTVNAVTQGANGTVAINADNTVTYTPNANFNGQDTFTYTIDDGNGGTDTATVTVTINAVNDAPDAVNDIANTAEDTAVNITVLANDVDVDGDALTVNAVTQGANGTVVINADNTVTYTPDNNFTGQDTFTYTISDGNGGTDTATVTVNVNAVNDNPDAVNDNAVTDEDTAVVINVLANDNDIDGDPLNVVNVTQGANGTVVINADNTVTYTPNANFNGQDTFTYTIDDGTNTDTATVTVTVNPINDAPIATDDVVTTNEDTAIAINVLANDNDVDGDALTVNAITNQPANGAVVINADNTITYTPNANFNGQDTFEYQVTDGNGGFDTATVTVNITAANDAPDAVDDVRTTNEDTAIDIDIVANDNDVDGDALTISAITNQPANGAVAINANNTVTYTPNANFNGQDTFEYQVTDGNGGFDTATVTINVTPVNDAPDAIDDAATTANNTAVTVGVLNNDVDVDGDVLDVVAITQANNGVVTLNANNTVTYTPNNGFAGNDIFTYTINDGNGGADTATVTITVLAPPPPPPPPFDFSSVGPDGGGGDGGGGGDCPLVLDVFATGLDLITKQDSQALFDLNGDGIAEQTAWVGSSMAILAIDRDGNGMIDDITEVFGNDQQDGFTELAQLEDTNNDGVVDANDARFSELQLWFDADGDGVSDAGELVSLADFGISSITVGETQSVSDHFEDSFVSDIGTFTRDDGTTGDAFSVFHVNNDNLDGHVVGTAGNDRVFGDDQDNVLDGAAGQDQIFASAGNDIILFDAADTLIDGGAGTDAVVIHGNQENVDTSSLANIETLVLGDGAQNITLSAQDVLSMNNEDRIILRGDENDTITLEEAFARQENTTQGGESFAVFRSDAGVEVFAELGLRINQEVIH